jgi:hypothetical protein
MTNRTVGQVLGRVEEPAKVSGQATYAPKDLPPLRHVLVACQTL